MYGINLHPLSIDRTRIFHTKEQFTNQQVFFPFLLMRYANHKPYLKIWLRNFYRCAYSGRIHTNLGLFLWPALISLAYTIYDLAGFGGSGKDIWSDSGGNSMRPDSYGHIFGFAANPPCNSGRRITRTVCSRTWGTCRWRR